MKVTWSIESDLTFQSLSCSAATNCLGRNPNSRDDSISGDKVASNLNLEEGEELSTGANFGANIRSLIALGVIWLIMRDGPLFVVVLVGVLVSNKLSLANAPSLMPWVIKPPVRLE